MKLSESRDQHPSFIANARKTLSVPIKQFVLYWIGGKSETISGDNISDAFRRAGYGAGALSALDYYETISPDNKGIGVAQ